ncbi:EAL domain-containing protein [Rhizobium leguminosarum]|uniref:EAL domain-containing protein n=1 Tax=Rhizobium leguminosarum TaxID=384 RepID=UPI001C958677|nr:EAL domain-containing protein [Rhizobium leguminosarum]MBY5395145.1 EAL domain-containing protein [Rhizobium leguminosarum]
MKGRRFRLSGLRPVRLFFILMMIGLPLSGQVLPFVDYLDNALVSWRFRVAPRAASGSIVYVAIDKRSLDAVGTWPWPRSLYAHLIDKLTAAGVDDIFIDVDFSTPSTLAEDNRLAKALADAGGGVILPVFKQYLGAEAGSRAVVTRPIPGLADNAWLSLANVGLDGDGTVRRFELGGDLDNQPTQSIAAVLAKFDKAAGSYPIDYSIAPASVPTFSLSDVLAGKVGRPDLEGRSVVVGAYATELKDIFPVPVYGALPGAMLHILASETILQKRLLEEIDQMPLELLFAAIVIAMALGMRSRPAAHAVALALAVVAAGEVTAFFLQKDHALIIHTVRPWIILLAGLVLLLNEKVDFGRFLVELANAEQRNTRRLLERIVADSADAVIAFDDRFRVLNESASTAAMLALEPGADRSRTLDEIIPSSLVHRVAKLASDYMAQPGTIHACNARFSLPADGGAKHLEAAITISPVERPDGSGIVATKSFIGSLIVRDMTARRRYEDKLQRLSEFDELTGLMNRREFRRRLDRLEGECHVIALGLHRFSVLNTAIGRDVGDELLRAVAARMEEQGAISLVGRLGGDVFAAVMPASEDCRQEQCARLILDLFREPFELGGSMIHVAARLGICTSPARSGDADLWIQNAEIALDDAKRVAGSGWRGYDPVAALRQHQSRLLERQMRAALERGEFFLLYQPQVDLKTGKLVGAEALLRWKHPEFGLVSPADFISVAEASGFICDLGSWALAEACRAAAEWPDGLNLAVNVSPIQFSRTELVAEVKAALAASGLAASRLHLEITESAFVDGSEQIMSVIRDLRALGIAIALDDFGTGYSSLSYMAGFPLDKLKIDQSFVRKIAGDPKILSIVATVGSLAHGLGLKVVAEGIETETEWQMLAQMGCEEGQGYFFGKPQSSAALIALSRQPGWTLAA